MLEELLKQHRAGSREAAKELTKRHLYLVDAALANQRGRLLPHHDWRELRSRIRYDLVQGVRALRNNRVAADDLERYLRAPLQHSFKYYLREVGIAIRGLTRVEVDDFDALLAQHLGPEAQAISNEEERIALALSIKLGYEMYARAKTVLENNIAAGVVLGIDFEDQAKMMAGPSRTNIIAIARRLAA
jgi:hypothetical protein